MRPPISTAWRHCAACAVLLAGPRGLVRNARWFAAGPYLNSKPCRAREWAGCEQHGRAAPPQLNQSYVLQRCLACQSINPHTPAWLLHDLATRSTQLLSGTEALHNTAGASRAFAGLAHGVPCMVPHEKHEIPAWLPSRPTVPA